MVVSEGVMIALIAATPPAIAAVLGYLANRRSLRRSVGGAPGVPLIVSWNGSRPRSTRLTPSWTA